ncbi:glycine cleavage system aminomethyltransferase GcvT [Luteithermobacter gelatinilyticus]|uniref:glycine cleavage system aminomethyltransferase GcvT n=1 Tax=Luteithermobacter gelatinilyticus TaxID=2582913 RepID=UPI001105D202|nr:glycine cleavage system aminomethyltransferase GcvT [Luteithermobacter gelatinilyticus]|tara:strand:+ start:517 stop:1650 length:1134 start_codon:yes stop_codon:yes gene_type:complete
MSADQTDLKKTPLFSLHEELGAKMVPFAGYAMPVQYPLGVMKEHLHTRAAAGLFDVSHMGQVVIRGENADAWMETLVPGNITALKPGRLRYTQFTNDEGGILDDLMVTKREDDLFLVVNAACKEQDIAHLKAHLPKGFTLTELDDRALVALQGPKAAEVMARFVPDAADMPFMSYMEKDIESVPCYISRCGYTGEDGFEISIPADQAEMLCRRLLAEPEVEAIGLGARDSLRLESGLCLYGHDITTDTTPVEADLVFSIAKRHKDQTGDEGGFPGDHIILEQLRTGRIARKRVGILPEGRAPAREGTEILNDHDEVIGHITSGGFGPTLGGPVAMGYVKADYATSGQPVFLLVRGKKLPAHVADMPFVEQRYYRKPK